MVKDVYQILILLILIQVALGSYYYLLHQDKKKMKSEDDLLLKLEEKFSDDNRCNALEKKDLPPVCNGFHDIFFKNNNKFLGWRYFYVKNQSNSQIPEDKNFSGTVVKSYLDNLENVKNYVTPKELQIR
jgi:hypothetical protein